MSTAASRSVTNGDFAKYYLYGVFNFKGGDAGLLFAYADNAYFRQTIRPQPPDQTVPKQVQAKEIRPQPYLRDLRSGLYRRGICLLLRHRQGVCFRHQ